MTEQAMPRILDPKVSIPPETMEAVRAGNYLEIVLGAPCKEESFMVDRLRAQATEEGREVRYIIDRGQTFADLSKILGCAKIENPSPQKTPFEPWLSELARPQTWDRE